MAQGDKVFVAKEETSQQIKQEVLNVNAQNVVTQEKIDENKALLEQIDLNVENMDLVENIKKYINSTVGTSGEKTLDEFFNDMYETYYTESNTYRSGFLTTQYIAPKLSYSSTIVYTFTALYDGVIKVSSLIDATSYDTYCRFFCSPTQSVSTSSIPSDYVFSYSGDGRDDGFDGYVGIITTINVQKGKKYYFHLAGYNSRGAIGDIEFKYLRIQYNITKINVIVPPVVKSIQSGYFSSTSNNGISITLSPIISSKAIANISSYANWEYGTNSQGGSYITSLTDTSLNISINEVGRGFWQVIEFY